MLILPAATLETDRWAPASLVQHGLASKPTAPKTLRLGSNHRGIPSILGLQQGYGGWDDPEVCSVEHLVGLLVGHLRKDNPGNWLDIAILSMMLHERGAPTSLLPIAVTKQEQPAESAPTSSQQEALGDLDKAYDGTEDPEEDWRAYYRVRQFIEQAGAVPEG